MLKIDDALLKTLGLDVLSETDRKLMLTHIYETLELRVGICLADRMSNEQVDEFETYFESRDDEGAFAWLEANIPDYKDVVQEQFESLKEEITEEAPRIIDDTIGEGSAES
jgi:hypothetical protein